MLSRFISIIWVIFCSPLLIALTITALYHGSVAIFYSAFIFLNYAVFSKLENTRSNSFIIIMTFLSTLAVCFISSVLIAQWSSLFSLKIWPFNDLPQWMGISYFMSGSLIAITIWFWVIAKKRNNLYKCIAMLEMALMLIITYGYSLSMDYFNLVLGHPPEMNS